MNTLLKDTQDWINAQDTKNCRTEREKAKYLVGKLVSSEIPHPIIWQGVLKLSEGLSV